MTMTGSAKYLLVWMLLILVMSEAKKMNKTQCQESGLHYHEDKNDCGSCVLGLNYNDGTIKDGCANCTVPGPGFYSEKTCTTDTNTIVRRCPNNTFSLTQNSTDCINYTQLITLKQCKNLQPAPNTTEMYKCPNNTFFLTFNATDCNNNTQLITCKNLQPAPDTGDACNCGVLEVFGIIGLSFLFVILLELVCIAYLHAKKISWFGKVLKRLSKRFDETPEDVPAEDITTDNSDFANVQERAAPDDALDEENQPMHFPSQASGDHESEESFIPVRR